MQIIPSILVPDEQTFLDWSSSVEDCLNMIQLDIADGKFVNNVTWADPEIIHDKLQIDCELHLMVEDPLAEARLWEEIPQIKRVLVHYESDPKNIADILAQIHSYGWEVGLVLNPETHLEVIDKLTEEIDSLMLMGVIPGKQGQNFIPETIDRLKACRQKYPRMFIELDGAVSEDTLLQIISTGIDAICPGSAIFGNHRTPKENIERMRKIINKLTIDKIPDTISK